MLVSDGPHTKTKEHVGGFLVLEAGDRGEALAWGRKAVVPCKAPVEVRPPVLLTTGYKSFGSQSDQAVAATLRDAGHE